MVVVLQRSSDPLALEIKFEPQKNESLVSPIQPAAPPTGFRFPGMLSFSWSKALVSEVTCVCI